MVSPYDVVSILAIVLVFNQYLSCSVPSEGHHRGANEMKLHKRSPPIFVPLNQVHFPQQHQLARQSQVAPVWTSKSLMDPANFPNPISQEDAKYLEQYMKNDYKDSDQSTLNLAIMNHRTNKPVARKMGEPNPSDQTRPQEISGSHSINYNEPVQRSDLISFPASSSRQDNSFARKGKVENVVITKQPNRATDSHRQPVNFVKQNLLQSILHPPMLNKFQENCITRSAQQAGMCEDHLIKRLTQDATEGRTVVDVGRRVCCALFWHKECIDSIVLKACPDSTPVAADYILGARKIDLATSCQRFNREGCNGSTKVSPAIANILPIVVSVFMILVCL